ncbi:hypothetical protein CVIRNUC_000940 [Coccomyxa viridis]|uniref:RING-type domain-containing protein n=1 Tax=Coccomyxa viridis TaxID=1274662 RepID=A0AAV1HS92_9CHLO|nr:hypothetical protein CVIRNUC_000940 [Coccomyxa viridis]
MKEGVFDSFSESNSREGSLRAGNALGKPPPATARLLACREEAALLGSTQLSGSQELGHARSRSVGSAASLHARLQGSDPDSLPLHWRQAVEDSDVPGCALFDHPCPVGPPPGARWGHASAAVGDRLYMFGGDGATMYSNGFVYDSVQNRWCAIPMPASRSEEALPPMSGHAACAVGAKIYLFGGRQGSQVRKYLRRLYIYDTELKTWKCPKKAASDPPGLLHATMTEVGRHGIFLFGGQSKRVTNAVHKCDPSTVTWSIVDTAGDAPCARMGHTAVWDFADSLVVFGGLSESAVLSDVYVLSLSSGFWTRKQCMGQAPSMRYGHSAVMIACNLMLVFGGCNGQGAYYNDCHILNTSSFCWHRLPGSGASPAGRHRHACGFAGGRVVVHGGSHGSHVYDNLFSISFGFGRDFNRIASTLATQQSARHAWPLPSQQVSHSSGSHSSGATSSAGVTTSALADPEAVRLQLANLLQRRSANDMQAFAARRADIAESLLQRERQQAHELQAQVAELQLLLEEQKREGEAARDELRQERNSMRRTQQNHMQHMEVAAADMRTLQARCAELEEQQGRLESQIRVAEQRCAATQNSADNLQQVNVQLRQHMDASHAITSQQAKQQSALRQRAADLENLLMVTQTRNADLAAELAKTPRRQQLAAKGDADADPERLACLQGNSAALAQCSLGQLYSLEGIISQSWQSLRDAIMAKVASDLRQREAALAERERAAEEATTCSLCMDRPKTVVFNCGHQICTECSAGHTECPFCREPITSSITLFQT